MHLHYENRFPHGPALDKKDSLRAPPVCAYWAWVVDSLTRLGRELTPPKHVVALVEGWIMGVLGLIPAPVQILCNRA